MGSSDVEALTTYSLELKDGRQLSYGVLGVPLGNQAGRVLLYQHGAPPGSRSRLLAVGLLAAAGSGQGRRGAGAGRSLLPLALLRRLAELPA